jgi:hypothetical protein
MLFQIVEGVKEFLAANAALIALVLTIVEYVKRAVLAQNFTWMKDWYITAFAFAVSFLFAIPADGFSAIGADPVTYIANSIGIGLVATGVYKVGATLVRKVTE